MHPRILDLRELAYLDYHRLDRDLTFWRTHAGHEVDFVIGDDIGIEIKATRRVTAGDLKGLRALSEDLDLATRIVVSMEPRERTTDEGIRVLPVAAFFERLWRGEIVGV